MTVILFADNINQVIVRFSGNRPVYKNEPNYTFINLLNKRMIR